MTLRPDTSLGWETRFPTEEGYSFQAYRWIYETEADPSADRIIREGVNGGRDCDGYICRDYDDECPIDRLKAYHPLTGPNREPDPEGWPDWVELGTSVYDAAAVAAGY